MRIFVREQVLLYSMFIALTVLCPFIWKKIAETPRENIGRKRDLLIVAASMASCSVLLSWMLLGLAWITEAKNVALSSAPVRAWAYAAAWNGYEGFFIALIVLTLSMFATPGLGRRLCVWWALIALVFWFYLTVFAEMGLLEIA